MDWGLVVGLGVIAGLIGVAFFAGKKVEKASLDQEKAEHKSDVADARVEYAEKQTEIDANAKAEEENYWTLSTTDRSSELERLLGGRVEGGEDTTSGAA